MSDMREDILYFIESLPSTIKYTELVLIYYYTSDNSEETIHNIAEEDILEHIKRLLYVKAPSVTGSILLLRAIFDLRFRDTHEKISFAKKAIKDLKSSDPNLSDMLAIDMALAHKHREIAATQWNDLRMTQLSDTNIENFYENLQKTQYNKML